MGTRGLYGFRVGRRYYLFWISFDAYTSNFGAKFVRLIRGVEEHRLRALCRAAGNSFRLPSRMTTDLATDPSFSKSVEPFIPENDLECQLFELLTNIAMLFRVLEMDHIQTTEKPADQLSSEKSTFVVCSSCKHVDCPNSGSVVWAAANSGYPRKKAFCSSFDLEDEQNVDEENGAAPILTNVFNSRLGQGSDGCCQSQTNLEAVVSTNWDLLYTYILDAEVVEENDVGIFQFLGPESGGLYTYSLDNLPKW